MVSAFHSRHVEREPLKASKGYLAQLTYEVRPNQIRNQALPPQCSVLTWPVSFEIMSS